MIKYNLKQINQNQDRFRKAEFVLYEDVQELMLLIVKVAVNAGADESKLMEFFDNAT